MSVEEACEELDISDDSYANWRKSNPDWNAAVHRFLRASRSWWIRKSRTTLDNRFFQDKSWSMNMMNRFGWNKKDETTIKGDVADAIKIMADRAVQRQSASTDEHA